MMSAAAFAQINSSRGSALYIYLNAKFIRRELRLEVQSKSCERANVRRLSKRATSRGSLNAVLKGSLAYRTARREERVYV